MSVLPDYLVPGLRVVFCGTAVSTTSAARGHYYAGPGNEFWPLLYESGLTPVSLAPEEDAHILDFGLGLTDLAKKVAASSDAGLGAHYDIDGFVRKIERLAPRWVAFPGKTAAREVSKAFGHGRRIWLGPQAWSIGSSSVFVLPSASAANRDPKRLEGRGIGSTGSATSPRSLPNPAADEHPPLLGRVPRGKRAACGGEAARPKSAQAVGAAAGDRRCICTAWAARFGHRGLPETA